MTGLKLYSGDPVSVTVQDRDGEKWTAPDVLDVLIADGALVLTQAYDGTRLTVVLAPIAWATVEWRRP